MKQKISSFLRDYWKKFVLVGVLGLACVLFDRMEFNSIEYLIRDSLQNLNSTKGIDNSIVTLNINTYSKNKFTYPHTASSFKKVIDKLQKSKPRFILIMMEPLDLTQNENEKKEIFDYFVAQKNIYINAHESRNGITTFYKDPIFRKYPNFMNLLIARDTNADKKIRRAPIYFNNKGDVELINDLKKLGFKPKDVDFYQYSWNFWETKQGYIKNYKLGTFGNYQTDDLIEDKIPASVFRDKVVLIGTHDEFSYLAPPSVFNTFVNYDEKNIKEYIFTFQDVVANIINFHSTGNYIKLLGAVNDIFIVFFIISIIILVNVELKKKLYLFFSLMPLILIFQILLYVTSSFYIDFSRSIALLLLIQYLAVPVVMFAIFKAQEQKKMREVNLARIDSLLLVSEIVAHDIRSPLSAINLILSKVKFDSPEVKEILNNSLKRISATADKILVKYKVTESSRNEIFEPINMVEVLKSLTLEKQFIDPKITYRLPNYQMNNLYVLGYKLELEQILSNILDNSIFALKNKGISPEITFELESKRDLLVLKIVDNGVGIQSGILTLLGKEKVTTKSTEKGNGIGLLHAKRIIERMDGTFEVNSIAGQQTIVTIILKRVNFNDTGSNG